MLEILEFIEEHFLGVIFFLWFIYLGALGIIQAIKKK